MRLKISWFIVSMVLFVLAMPNDCQSREPRGVGIITTKERRIALVIGNGDYKQAPLANPVNDANDMAEALKRCDFDVIKRINASRTKMRSAMREFGNKIRRGGRKGQAGKSAPHITHLLSEEFCK